MNLQNKIDFVAIVTVNMANPNGDPLNGNRPRTDFNGFGEMSDVSIKRKIRNRMQDLGNAVFVQSADRCDDGFKSLSERAVADVGKISAESEYARIACEKWLDVRAFGQLFAFKSNEKSGVSIGVRGPVSIHQAVSVTPVEVESLQITKSVNSEPSDKRSSDTMGMKHFVRFGVYKIKGSINIQLAQKTGFTGGDADIIKECLRTLFINDSSAARPDGSMQVAKLFWWEHNCAIGQYSAAKVHNSVKVEIPIELTAEDIADLDKYIRYDELSGLKCEIIDGL